MNNPSPDGLDDVDKKFSDLLNRLIISNTDSDNQRLLRYFENSKYAPRPDPSISQLLRFEETRLDEKGSKPRIDHLTEDGVLIKKLFIANLAERTTYRDLINVFSKYGKVESCYLKRNANKSNYAFVTYDNFEDALKAREEGLLRNIRLHNRDLRVYAADSWHQPGSLEHLCLLAQLKPNSPCEDSVSSDDSETDQEPPLIDKLNDDCLIQIFQFLPVVDRIRIERVCKRWRTVSLNSWQSCRHLRITSIFRDFVTTRSTPVIRKVLMRCGKFVTAFYCDIYLDVPQSLITVITKWCPNITKIDISNITVTPAGISTIISTYSNLTEFTMGYCTYVCDSDLKKLFEKNRKLRICNFKFSIINGSCLLALPEELEELVLSDMTELKPSYIAEALERLKNLNTLIVIRCLSILDTTLRAISGCDKITTLVLNGFFYSLDPRAMYHIAGMKKLQQLSIRECHTDIITDYFVSKIMVLTQLRSLDITQCTKITAQGVSMIFSLPNLEHLEMSKLTIRPFRVNTKSNTPLKLKTLDCGDCCELTDDFVCSVIESAPSLNLLVLKRCFCLTKTVIEFATQFTKKRTNNILLKLDVQETSLSAPVNDISPLLHVVTSTKRVFRDEDRIDNMSVLASIFDSY